MDGDVELRCGSCGRPLAGDPDDEPDGGGHGQPICGACNRARNFDALLVELDAANGDR